jgi:four helix bundle protein
METNRGNRRKVSHFTDLEVWQLARELARQVYAVTRRNPMAKDFAMVGQVRKSVISISSNIAEGFERDGNREFIQFLSIAKGSCGELESQLILSADQEYLNGYELEERRNLIRRISAMIQSLSNRLKRSEYRGRKFSPPPNE